MYYQKKNGQIITDKRGKSSGKEQIRYRDVGVGRKERHEKTGIMCRLVRVKDRRNISRNT